MEFSSNYILSSNGCLNETDYNLHIKKDKSDIIFQNSGSMVDSKTITQHQDNKSIIIENDIKLMPQSICENQKSSKMKRKLTECHLSPENIDSSSKVCKFSEPSGLQNETLNDTNVTNEDVIKPSENIVTKHRRSLWIMSCDRCSFETENMDEFACHIDTLHANLNNYGCNKCTYSTTSSTLLEKHDRYESLLHYRLGANNSLHKLYALLSQCDEFIYINY